MVSKANQAPCSGISCNLLAIVGYSRHLFGLGSKQFLLSRSWLPVCPKGLPAYSGTTPFVNLKVSLIALYRVSPYFLQGPSSDISMCQHYLAHSLSLSVHLVGPCDFVRLFAAVPVANWIKPRRARKPRLAHKAQPQDGGQVRALQNESRAGFLACKHPSRLNFQR